MCECSKEWQQRGGICILNAPKSKFKIWKKFQNTEYPFNNYLLQIYYMQIIPIKKNVI